MELIDQHTKKIMEGCKARARAAGLQFQDESLEYIVTNRDLLELSPKMMIPTLYDYWVHDVDVLKEKGKYELYPSNPYETVINTRPAISFYNDNNPDWLNVMIFYHVLGHIDFFQNNHFFAHTWPYDFTGRALSDKRMIAALRAEKGRWVDYVIEFARAMDNLVGYHEALNALDRPAPDSSARKVDYYFDQFLQAPQRFKMNRYIKEIQRYNQCRQKYGQRGDDSFFARIDSRYPEFAALYKKDVQKPQEPIGDVMQYVLRHSDFLNREPNRWMQAVIEVVRQTALFFQPQIRTKIMNEGWASFWHETLFMQDDRISGHEVTFARVNASVTAMPRVGLNPYGLGMRLFYHIEQIADQGRLGFDFQRLQDIDQRRDFDCHTGTGRQTIFNVRAQLNDFLFINRYVDQDFIDRHKLFVAGRRLDAQRQVWQYFVQSRKAEDYRQMLFDALYHPPKIEVTPDKAADNQLYLTHRFEGKPLVTEFIANALMGVEYLWGHPVKLETSEVANIAASQGDLGARPAPDQIRWQRVVYTMAERKLTRTEI